MSLQLPPFTATDAAQRLQEDGLLSLGVAAPLVAASWSAADVTLDESALTLRATNEVRAPFLAIRSWTSDVSKAGLYAASGAPLSGTAAVLRLHPEAANRLGRLVDFVLGPAGAVRPIPEAVVIRAFSTTPTLTTPHWFRPDAKVTDDGTFSFHDGRGQIIDPIAVAELFGQLMSSLIGLQPAGMSTAPGGVGDIRTKGAPGIVAHIVDPHGNPFAGVDGVVPKLVDAGGAVVGDAPLGAPFVLAADRRVGPPTTGAGATRLRVGWWRNGVLGRVPLDVPSLPAGVTLRRQFLRICAADLDWHLLGNRSATARNGIPPDDGAVPAEFRPLVRDRVRVDYLVDGVDTLAAAGQVLAPLSAGAWSGIAVAASPAIEPAVGVPPAPGLAGHWPSFPPPPAPGPAPTGTPTDGLTAAWSGDQDVVLTFPGGTIAIGSHVRVYPQVFQLITSIGEAPSFLRGDGGAALVNAPGPFSLLLRDPLNLPTGASQPPGSVLIFDLVVADRTGQVRIFGNVNVPVAAGAPPAIVDQFATPDPLGPVASAVLRSVAPSPVFGVPLAAPTATGSPPGSVVDLVRRLASETVPRSGPRLPTMARFPTLVAVGTGPTTAPLAWEAVVSGGRWARETRSADHARGNPGNPAGPDVHAPAVHVDGAAAFDVAQIGLRRAQPLLPMGGGMSGWIPFVANTGWVAPAEAASDAAPPGQAPRTAAAAVLRTVAVACETPELTLPGIPMPAPTASVQSLVNDIAAALGVTPPTVTVTNEPQIVREIRREFQWSRFGSRDAQWALRRAVRQARDLVLIVSPGFALTARPSGAPAAHEVDLVSELADRMSAHRSLRVLIALPRWPDAALAYGGWVREAFEARIEALDALRAVDGSRVAAFHPHGFPGRPAAIRTSAVIVDDAWALVGTSHWRRRGMTFDEGVDVAALDRDLDDGSSGRRVRAFRQALLLALTGAGAPTAGTATDDIVQFAGLRSCFDFVADLVRQGGLGRLSPLWSGPTDTDVIAQSHAVADPDGGSSSQFLTLLAGLIGESP